MLTKTVQVVMLISGHLCDTKYVFFEIFIFFLISYNHGKSKFNVLKVPNEF